MSEWRPIRVTITMGDDEVDALGIFNGYTQGNRWNGWATPAFTREEGLRIARWTDALAERYPEGTVERVWWDDERQAFVMEDPTYPHVPSEPLPTEDVVPGFWCSDAGAPLYGIGAYKWTWEEAVASRDPVGATE